MRYKHTLTWIAGLVIASHAFAQQGEAIDTDLQREITRESGNVQAVTDTPVAKPGQKIVILNQQPVGNQGIQQQPTTHVEATPLTESRAAQMRRVRENAELQTEQKIVEKLEKSRLEDEQRRADRLFGNKMEAPEAQPVTPAAPVVQMVPAQQVQQAPQAQEPSISDVKDELVQSVRAELAAQKEERKSKSRTYMSGAVGVTQYQDAINVESNYATGFSVGTLLDSGLAVEGSFTYSNFYIDPVYWYRSQSVYDELDQYNIDVPVKYSLPVGMLRPFVGAVGGYTYRKYTEKNIYADRYWSGVGKESKSDAFDVGLLAGLDVQIGDNFVIGFEYRYVMNITSKTDSPYLGNRYRSVNIGRPLEDFDYSTFAVVGKILF